jgi:hypothetical protein
MSIQFHDPRAEPVRPAEPYKLKLSSGEAKTIGMLANGFPDSDTFLEAVEAAIAEIEPGFQFLHFNKHNASVPVWPELLGEMMAECDAVIAAYGH